MYSNIEHEHRRELEWTKAYFYGRGRTLGIPGSGERAADFAAWWVEQFDLTDPVGKAMPDLYTSYDWFREYGRAE